jgi:23S rRNA G2069 N7-methylase RlmK/C1962 C5-methylase RlmI
MLANRVRKNARHLGKWARREGVSCWRVYDRDIPELPITVDTYEGALVINDYRAGAPGERGGGAAWLAAAVAAAREALGATEVHVKQRERLVGRRAGHQYERRAGAPAPGAGPWRAGASPGRGLSRGAEDGHGGGDGAEDGDGDGAEDGYGGGDGAEDGDGDGAEDGAGDGAEDGDGPEERGTGAARGGGAIATGSAWHTVREGGHAFRVNLSDYVDTGLFLDHRLTRAAVARERARTMLNLFAYTGSFSVYAAAAGMATTTVDLSRTYLEWAGENLALNGLTSELVHADVRELLAEARRRGRRWDLVVVDPPTFSNSKRMAYTWDVQRDHAALLADVRAVVAPGGAVWLSTHRRRFKLAADVSDWAAVDDRTRATIPPDFRDPRAHHAFRLVPR